MYVHGYPYIPPGYPAIGACRESTASPCRPNPGIWYKADLYAELPPPEFPKWNERSLSALKK